MRIAILGAGGVGGYFGGLLARAGHEVVLLARGAHLDVIRERGIEVRTPEGAFLAPVEATDDPDALGPAEYSVISVKGYSLPEVAPAARGLAETGSVIVPLLNGVEVIDRLIGLGVPADRLLGGLTAISAARVGPGIVERFGMMQRVVVGELAIADSDRAERFAEAVRGAGAEAVVAGDIDVEVWRKFAFIASVAAACGLARSPIGPLRDTVPGRLLIERLVHEAIAVGRARGVALPRDLEDEILRFIESIPAEMKPSLLRDLEASRPTEIDDLSGAVSRLGRRTGVKTPAHDTATAALGGRGWEQPEASEA